MVLGKGTTVGPPSERNPSIRPLILLDPAHPLTILALPAHFLASEKSGITLATEGSVSDLSDSLEEPETTSSGRISMKSNGFHVADYYSGFLVL